MIDDDVDKRDKGEISTSDMDEEATFRFVLQKLYYKYIVS